MHPTLGIVIPSAGRDTLRRTLDSMAPQMREGDRCIVVGDTLDGPLPQTEAIVADYPWCRYVAFRGLSHTFGNAEINHGLPLVGGDWVLCQDDDDIYTPDAFDAIRATIRQLHRPRPLLFRFRSYHGGMVFWDRAAKAAWDRGRVLLEHHIGGHCLVAPNVPGRVGLRGLHYQGDYTWIADTVRRWEPVRPLWIDRVIAVARPKE